MKYCSLSSNSTYVLGILFFLVCAIGYAQDVKVQVVGGSVVSENQEISITSGNSIAFTITNTLLDCPDKLKIESVAISNTTDFELTLDNDHNLPRNIVPSGCNGGLESIDFTITNVSGNCAATTEIYIEIKKTPIFIFTFSLSSSPEINVLGGSPSADIFNGSTNTSATNGTFFGVIDEGNSETRYFVIANTGSCPLEITNIVSSSAEFSVPAYVLTSGSTPLPFTASVAAGDYVILPITFVAPTGGTGTLSSTITIYNNDNTSFTYDVSAEMFNYNIPGPGGITADFRLWLKSTRGVIYENGSSSVVKTWKDIGTNGKDATSDTLNRPTYVDSPSENINFNPVLKFENDGSTVSQYLYNADNGFYNQDMFVVMQSDEDVSTVSGMTIFSGSIADIMASEGYVDDTNDVTGIGLGDYTSNLSGEYLWYNQGSSATNPYYALPASSSRSYATAGIINVGNKTSTVSNGMRIIYNSIEDVESPTQSITTFENVGYVDTIPEPDVVYGTPYFIGKNKNASLGNLNGRVAEIFTFAERVSDVDRQKIESYLAIKYGITLGEANQAQKDYINSFGTVVWDVSVNSGYNYHVAGIARDSISDLNQKQSKSQNETNEVTIGLDGIFSTNNLNVNEFNDDGDFLVWGCNNAGFFGTSTNTVNISNVVSTEVTRIDRIWKIVETTESSGDVGNVYVSIPESAFSSFSLAADEEYVLIVTDNENFVDNHIIDVVPLSNDGVGNLKTWYDFDGTKYFTFGKAPKLSENHAVSFTAGDYMVGEANVNLNVNDFTISAWVKADASQTSTRTIMAKGSKLQLRLNSLHQVEVLVDDNITPRFISTMALTDNKWHHIAFVYNSGTIYLYVDGVLDKTELNVSAPSPNFNNFSIGALYVSKNDISNPFLGDIDEVCIWDQGLTESQVRYLMNQEIEEDASNKVTGKIIPAGASSNELANIPWSTLRGYYDFNNFCGTTVVSQADNNFFLRIKYLEKDKKTVVDQNIPVPYISMADGAWDSVATWENSNSQMLPNSVALDGSTRIDWNIVEMSHDIYSGDRNISLLGLKSHSGEFTITDPNEAQNEINSGQSLTITHYLELDGVIDLVGESQLIQSEGSVLDADSGGYLERDQQGFANSYNYNYWSSSLGPIIGNTSTEGSGINYSNSNYSIKNVLYDGTDTDNYVDINFKTSAYAADLSTPSSPCVISTRWLYKFYGDEGDYYSWNRINQNSQLLPGEGYTMKGTSGAANLSEQQNYVFKGVPYNGDIELELDKSSGDVERLIGNPYPSAIDATEFILDNLSVDDGGYNEAGTIFNGALYFWDHFGEENTHVLRGYVGGYATRNLIGGAAAISIDGKINNNLASGTKIPGPYISVNQGFFVSTKLDNQFNDSDELLAKVDGGVIVFKNSQRVFAREDDTGSIFFKQPNTKGKTISNKSRDSKIDETPIIRLGFDSPMGYHRQIVLGVKDKASKGFDLGYDALMADIGEEDMYWLIGKHKFVIQGINHINELDAVSIGLKVKQSGLVTISIDSKENIADDLPILIKDNITGEVINIQKEVFQVSLDSGTYNERFSLVFKEDNSLKVGEKLILTSDIITYYDSKNAAVVINGKGKENFKEVELYNILGQLVKVEQGNGDKKILMPVQVASGAYILKIKTFKGVFRRKIIIE